MSKQHPSTQQLLFFVMGRLSDAEIEHLAIHLAECVTCIETIVELWEHPLVEEDGSIVALNETISSRVQQNLIIQIQHSHLNSAVVNISVKGFLSVCAALLRPVFRGSKL